MGALVVPGAAMRSGPSHRPRPRRGRPEQPLRAAAHATPTRARRTPTTTASRTARRIPDHDGLTNRQERTVGTNPLKGDTDHDGIKDGQDDQDHDGLRNKHELQAGTDPEDTDTDNDGVEDGQEDSDHDGVDNENEQEDGTNPGDADTDDDGIKDGEDDDANGDGHDDQCELVNGDDSPLCEDDGSRARRGRRAGADRRSRLTPGVGEGRRDREPGASAFRVRLCPGSPTPSLPSVAEGTCRHAGGRRGIVGGHTRVAPDAPHPREVHDMTQLAEQPATTTSGGTQGQPLDRWLHRGGHVRSIGPGL